MSQQSESLNPSPLFVRPFLKELLISPTLLEQNGIPFTRMMQQPGEFVVTYPGAYHSGFNTGGA